MPKPVPQSVESRVFADADDDGDTPCPLHPGPASPAAWAGCCVWLVTHPPSCGPHQLPGESASCGVVGRDDDDGSMLCSCSTNRSPFCSRNVACVHAEQAVG